MNCWFFNIVLILQNIPRVTNEDEKRCLCFIIEAESSYLLLCGTNPTMAESSENWSDQHKLIMQRTADIWSETRLLLHCAFPSLFEFKIPLWEFLDIFRSACIPRHAHVFSCSTLNSPCNTPCNLSINLWIPHTDASPTWINMFI